jgi:AraC-like DNA-binding protein
VDVTSLLALPLRVGVASCQSFGELIEAVFREPKGAVGVAALAALARRQELAFRALRLLCELAPLRDDAPELLRQRHRLGPVLELMRERLSEPVCVAELARRAGLSVPQFHAFFRRFMGRTPMEHLRQLRLSEACRLLVTADEPLRNVAEKTGFCNEFHLSREFRRVFGRPPGRWRREHDRTMG